MVLADVHSRAKWTHESSHQAPELLEKKNLQNWAQDLEYRYNIIFRIYIKQFYKYFRSTYIFWGRKMKAHFIIILNISQSFTDFDFFLHFWGGLPIVKRENPLISPPNSQLARNWTLWGLWDPNLSDLVGFILPQRGQSSFESITENEASLMMRREVSLSDSCTPDRCSNPWFLIIYYRYLLNMVVG